MKTYAPRPRDIERRWYVIDADGAVLGRLASEIAKILRGKHKPIFAPHADTGDHVIVINARGVRLTGGKELKKVAYRHSGYPGGLRATGYDRLLAQRPASVIEKAVRGMLPKNRLGRAMFGKLKVYEGAEHPHGPQKPVALTLGEVPRWDGLPKEPAEPAAKPAKKAPKAAPKEVAPAEDGPEEDGAEATTRAKRSTAAKATGTGAAKRSTAKRSTAKSSTAKRSTTKRSAAKRSTAGGAKASTKASKASSSGSTDKPKRTRRSRKKKDEEG